MKPDIEITYDEKSIKGTYEISKGMITVFGPYGSKSASTSSNNDALAKIILRELAQEAEGRGW